MEARKEIIALVVYPVHEAGLHFLLCIARTNKSATMMDYLAGQGVRPQRVNRIIVLSVFAFFYGMATLLRAVERASFQYGHLGVARIVGSECERVKKVDQERTMYC